MMNCFTKLYKNVVILTGAGVSTASGLPTYRVAGGLWADPDTARFSSPEGCVQDPDAAWRFWSTLREKSLQAEPNATHSALSDLVNLEPMQPTNKAFDIELLGTGESLVPRLEAEFFFNQKMCKNDLPPAEESHEEYAHVRFDMKMSPDEHAAREAHLEMLGGLDSVRYADPLFDAWVHRYYSIVRAHEYLRQCRLKYLTADELVEVEREVEDY